MIILGIVAVVLACLDFSNYPIVLCICGISGLGGYEVRGQIEETFLEWRAYYFRIIGYFLAFGGGGLVFDELLHGPLSFWPPLNHEVYGVVIGILGLILISRKPRGKGL